MPSSMRAREAVAARGRIANASQAATHAAFLQVVQTQRTPEELAADAADDKHDMLTRVAESRQAAHHRALRAQEQQQQDQAEKAEKTAKKRAADRERMQKRLSRAGGAQLSLCVFE